jgi:hypothetical protein
MKKLAIFLFAALLVVAFTMPAAALENVFGGYWRTRFYTNQNFTGEDKTEKLDYTVVDTRTRLYYTAILNDDLKFVNKFEMDGTWGGNDKSGTGSKGGGSYSDIGADGVNLEIKNSYADFNLGPMKCKVGVQGLTVARGFLFDDDFAGLVVAYADDMMTVPFVWMKAYEGGSGMNKRDFDYYAIAPTFKLSEVMSINPFILYAASSNARDWSSLTGKAGAALDSTGVFYVGMNFDMKLDTANFWFTGIYEGGSADLAADTSQSVDITAYLVAFGGGVDLGPADVHGQVFYATGQDPDDKDVTAFFVPQGQSYYWAEIMGYGIFDQQVSNASCADQIGNILAANIGAGFKPMDEMKVAFDLWYATLAEDDANGKKIWVSKPT